jgi:diadenylate cyclase
MFSIFETIGIMDILDIILVSVFLYGILMLVQGERSFRVVQGLILLLVISLLVYFLSQRLGLETVNWVVQAFIPIAIIIFIIAFQPELRRVLTQMGGGRLRKLLKEETDENLIEISKAIRTLANKRIGALIVFEQDNPIKGIKETGTEIDSRISSDILISMFMPQSLLHDGAVIINNDRLDSAGCLLPLSQQPNLSRDLGTRHRAALGVTEDSDAVAFVVSEERGSISYARNGKLVRDINPVDLRQTLFGLFLKSEIESEQTGA